MSNYGRGKRRYHSNGYNGSYRRGRHNKNTDYYNTNNSQHFNDPMANDNSNKPFRILQRKQGGNDAANPINTNNINTNIHSPTNQSNNMNNTPPRFNINHNNNNSNQNIINNNNISNDNVAAVLQNVISEPPNSSSSKDTTLGHQLLSMQKRGQRLYKYKRKDGTGSAIPIPQHHKKNYNKSIGRGKKFDKEREAALQALAAQNLISGDKTTEENVIKNESDTNNPIISDNKNLTLGDNNTGAPGLLKVQQQSNEDITPTNINEDTRSWRRSSDRGSHFRPRSRGRGRRGRGKKYNSHYYNRHRNFAGDKWSDEEDYNRDRGYGGKSSRWDKRRSKFEPPRHRNQHNHEWDKYPKNNHDMSGAFGSNIVNRNDDTLQSPNIGPRAQRHYNKNKFNNTKCRSPSGGNDGNNISPNISNSILHKWDANTLSNKTDEDSILTEESNTNIDLENDILSSYLSCYDNNIRERKCKSVPFLDVRMCPHVLNEIEEHLTDCTDFLVIGVIGQQGVGKSTILSYLAGHDAKEDVFLTSELSKLISSTHTTHGIQCYISSERIIYLDCQPILSPSILFSLTNHRRRCIREKSHESIISPMETWDIEMAKHSLFLSCICHMVLVVSDTIPDIQSTHFIRSVYALRQSMKINSFLRHDSSLRKKLKDLQMKINEKYDKKKSNDINMKLLNAQNIRPQSSYSRHQWVKHKDKIKGDEKKQSLGEEDALFYGIDESVEEDYKLFKLLNAQQRYGFPDVIFIQNKVSTFDMTPHRFDLQRKFLYTMFKHQYFTKEGEIGNSELLGMSNDVVNEVSIKIPTDLKELKESDDNDEDVSDTERVDKEEYVREMSRKMNLFFLPRVQANKLEFENGCIELRNQIMSMGKPQSISQSHSYKQTERDWFSFSKKIWHIIANAPNFIEYRGNHNHSNT